MNKREDLVIPSQKTKYRVNEQEGKTRHLVDFAVLADQIVKAKDKRKAW